MNTAGEPHTVHLAVGSNIEPRTNIVEALRRLQKELKVEAVSTFYRTVPWDGRDGPEFLNGVFRVRTARSPRDLKFGLLRGVEGALGRVRTADRHAPRSIDLDILLYGRKVVDSPDLRIPDPDLRQRPFLAVPLLELEPELTLPDTGERLDRLPVARKNSELAVDDDLTAKLRRLIDRENTAGK